MAFARRLGALPMTMTLALKLVGIGGKSYT
jgi:hypothetical protein